MRTIGLALAALIACAGPAFAQEELPCMAPIAITPQLVEQAGQYDFRGYAGSANVPAFLVGFLSPTRYTEDRDDIFGTVVFVRGDEGWRAFLPSNGKDAVAIYATDAGAVMIATMRTSEGPGQSWTLLRSPEGLASGACSVVAFPSELNKPSWNNEMLDLTDFDINAHGRGEIIGMGSTEERGDLWYVYRTRDYGASWSAPQRLRRERAARSGVYRQIVDEEAAAPEALVAELTVYASRGSQ